MFEIKDSVEESQGEEERGGDVGCATTVADDDRRKTNTLFHDVV